MIPLTVPLWFLAYIIEYGLLRVRRIHFEYGVNGWIGAKGETFTAEELHQMRVIDMFCHLLGFEGWFPGVTALGRGHCMASISDVEPGLSDCQGMDLQLDLVEVAYDGSIGECSGIVCFSR